MPWPARGGSLHLPGDVLVGPFEAAERDAPEGAHSVAEPVADRGDRPQPHADGVALEVQLDEALEVRFDELSEPSAGIAAGSPSSSGSMTSR